MGGAILIPVSHLYITVLRALRRYLLQRDTVKLVYLVKLIDKAMLKAVIPTAVPGIKRIVGRRIIIHGSPDRPGLCVKRTVNHSSLRGYRADNMPAHLSCFRLIDQLILRHLRRILIRSLRLGNQRRPALPQIVHACHIDLITRQVLKIRYGIAAGCDSFCLRILLRPGFSVIYMIKIRILHPLPGYVYRTVSSLCPHIIRSIRSLIYLGNHHDGSAVSASPGAVHRLYADCILLAVDKLILLKGTNV